MKKELNLDVRQHPAVQAVENKRQKAAQDIKRLEEVAREAENEVAEARRALGRIELARAMGEAATGEEEATRKLLLAESKLSVTREEIGRRREVTTDLKHEEIEAIHEALAEFTEEVKPRIRSLTQQYLEAVLAAFRIGEELDKLYGPIQKTNSRVRIKYDTNQVIRTPHGNPHLRFKLDWQSGDYAREVQRYLENFKNRGYGL